MLLASSFFLAWYEKHVRLNLFHVPWFHYYWSYLDRRVSNTLPCIWIWENDFHENIHPYRFFFYYGLLPDTIRKVRMEYIMLYTNEFNHDIPYKWDWLTLKPCFICANTNTCTFLRVSHQVLLWSSETMILTTRCILLDTHFMRNKLLLV